MLWFFSSKGFIYVDKNVMLDIWSLVWLICHLYSMHAILLILNYEYKFVFIKDFQNTVNKYLLKVAKCAKKSVYMDFEAWNNYSFSTLDLDPEEADCSDDRQHLPHKQNNAKRHISHAFLQPWNCISLRRGILQITEIENLISHTAHAGGSITIIKSMSYIYI